MMTAAKYVLFVLLSLAGLNGFAQERILNAALDRDQIMIGEQVQLTLTLKAATPDTVVFPEVPDLLQESIEVLERSKIDTHFTGDQLEQRVLTQTLLLTSFDSGYYAVPPIAASINSDSIEAAPFLLSVQTIPIDTAKGIADIKDIRDIPFSWSEWLSQNWPWIALVVALLGIISAVAYYFGTRESKPVDEQPVIPSRPAYEIALEELEALQEAKLWQAGKTKKFYVELSNILRAFLEGHFGIYAMEQTSHEIVQALNHSTEIDKEEQKQLKQVLFLADLVKFAKEKPIGSENERNFEIVLAFVRLRATITQTPENEHPETQSNG